MTAFRQRFVGVTELPKSLSDFDVEQSFRLTSEEIDAIRKKFNTAGRLGGALQLVLIRTTGRPLNRVTSIPRSLLRYLSVALGVGEVSIATLKSLYERRATLFAHQQWAIEISGFSAPDEAVFAGIRVALAKLVGTAASSEELVKAAEIWLFDRTFLLPGDRALRDIARETFKCVDDAAAATVVAQIPAPVMRRVLEAVHAKRRGRGGGTVLEWLKVPTGRHSPSNLNEVMEKIAFLKSFGVHEWDLQEIYSVRLRAYGQALVNRPPSQSRLLKIETQQLEVACFLRMMLQEFTDVALFMAGRRVCDLVRHASATVLKKQARGAAHYRMRQEEMRTILYTSDQTDKEIVAALKALLPQDEDTRQYSHAALVRESLTDDSNRVNALLTGMMGLDINGKDNLPAMRQMEALRRFHEQWVKDLPKDFDITMVEPVWQELLMTPDRSKAMAALKACALTSVRKGLRAGRLWINYSQEHRNREELFIPLDQWRKERSIITSAMSLPTDPKRFLERLKMHLKVGLQALSEAVQAGAVEIDDKGLIHIPALAPMDVDEAVRRTRDAMFTVIGQSQFSDVIVEVDAHCCFSEVLLGRRAKSEPELLGCYGALLAHGTENDAKGVAAMIPGIEVAHVTTAMRALEAHGRLKGANERVLALQKRFPIATLWDKGDKASSDMMSLDASKHIFNARVDPRRRTHAVGIYTHVLGSYGVFHDEAIVLNERQHSIAVHGVETYNASRAEDEIKLSLLAVDTHGYTNVAMSVAKLLGFDLCPRLRNLSEQRLFLPRGFEVPDALDLASVCNISESAIVKGWDEVLRLVASIRQGRVSAKFALEKLGSAAQGDLMHKAADQLGRLLRTLYLCDYFSNTEFRREIHTLLNRGESVHQLQRAVFHGRVMPERGHRRDEIRAISGSHILLTNIVIAWNTLRMQSVVDRWHKEKYPIEESWIRRMGPVHFGNINFRGMLGFEIKGYADALLQTAQPMRKKQQGA